MVYNHSIQLWYTGRNGDSKEQMRTEDACGNLPRQCPGLSNAYLVKRGANIGEEQICCKHRLEEQSVSVALEYMEVRYDFSEMDGLVPVPSRRLLSHGLPDGDWGYTPSAVPVRCPVRSMPCCGSPITGYDLKSNQTDRSTNRGGNKTQRVTPSIRPDLSETKGVWIKVRSWSL